MGICNMDESKTTKISVLILGSSLFFILGAYMVFGDSNDEKGLRNLRMVSVLFRHGDRTPSELYPNDPYSNYEWAEGFGALSQKGSLQAYNLGKNLRTRYYRLLPTNGMYSQNEIHIMSSAAERCLMSAQSLLAGFMPPLENQNILPINWQPIAVNSIPRQDDILLAQKKPCRNYDDILEKLYKHPPLDLEIMNKKNQDLYEYLTKYSGWNITNVLDVEKLYNILEIERDTKLILPAWTEDVFPNKMRSLVHRSYALFTETAMMKKIKGGAFVTHIHNKMIMKRRRNLHPDRKIFLFSGHDVTLVNVMNSMGILNQTSRKPEYSSALVFELHHSRLFDDDFEVKIVYYFNSEDKFPTEIQVPGCSSPCSLNKFTKSIEHLMLVNYDETCNNV